MKIGLLGAGYIASPHVKAIQAQPGLEIAAICDMSRFRAESIARIAGSPAIYTSLEEMLQNEKLDCIHNLLPPDCHASTTEKIVEAGIHVFLEKPMAVTWEECDRVTSLADKLGLRIGVNHNFLFYKPYEQLKNAIHEGELGPLNHVTLTWQKPLGQIQKGPFNQWMLRDTPNTLLEVFPHLGTCLIDLIGKPDTLWSEPSDPVALSTGVRVFRRWMIVGQVQKTCVELRIALNPGFEEHTLDVRGLAGVGYVDFERNLCVIRQHTPSSRPIDLYRMTRAEASTLARQAGRNLWNYVGSKLKWRTFGDPYVESIYSSVREFYANFKKPLDFRHSPGLAMAAMSLAEKIAKPYHSEIPGAKIGKKGKDFNPEILITGGTGFIGQALLRDLLHTHHRVRLIVRDPDKLGFEDQRMDVWKGDLNDKDLLQKSLEGVKTVYHLARVHANTWKEYMEGVETTRLVAETALELKVSRFVYTGTIDTYFGGKTGEVITEVTPIDPQIARRNLYAQAKAKEEQLLVELQTRKGLPLVIVRPGIVIGEGAHPCHWGVGMWYYESICHYWGKGNHPLPFVLVDDVAKGIRLAGEVVGIEGESFNLIDIPCLSAREYVEELSCAAGMKIRVSPHSLGRYYLNECVKWVIKVLVRRPETRLPSYHDWASRVQCASYDCFRARKVLGWHPVSNREKIIEEGIRKAAKEWVE